MVKRNLGMESTNAFQRLQRWPSTLASWTLVIIVTTTSVWEISSGDNWDNFFFTATYSTGSYGWTTLCTVANKIADLSQRLKRMRPSNHCHRYQPWTKLCNLPVAFAGLQRHLLQEQMLKLLPKEIISEEPQQQLRYNHYLNLSDLWPSAPF